MGTLIRSSDLRRVYIGAGLAVIAGLTLGGAVQPPLADGIVAPQQAMAGGGMRNYAAATTRDVGAYPGQVPDYVIGTNYTRPLPVAEQVLAYEERAEPTAYDIAEHARTAEAVTTIQRRWADEPREETVYPSQQGGAFNPSDLPPPPEPPVDLFEPA
jgi:hypothetical protein